MREVNAMPGLEIHLGRVGENMAVCVVLDVTDWRQTYGDGSVQLLHKRNGDQYPYPCAIEVDGGRVCWPVTASDVAVAGKGWAELQYLVGDVVVKSETYATRTERALGQTGPTPPEPHEGWVQQVLEAGAQVEVSAEEAADAAARAQEHAESVAELKEVAVQAHDAAVEALEALEGIDEAQQAVAADRAAIEAMTVTSETLEPGEDATVEKRKQDGVMTLHFGIPTGDSGVYVGTTKPTDPNVRVWINPNGKANDNPGGGGGSGADGEDGGYYTPAVTDGVLTWKASKAEMPAVPAANVKGDPGKDGGPGPAGADGLTPYIGDNGNWFIGDTDTGVSAGGGGSTGGGGGENYIAKTVTLASGTIPTGTTANTVTDTGLTIGDLRKYKRFVLFAKTQSQKVSWSLSWRSTWGRIGVRDGTSVALVYEWLDSTKTVVEISYGNNTGYESVVGNISDNASVFNPPVYKYPVLVTLGDDATKIYVQHSEALTVDATWEVKGGLEYA